MILESDNMRENNIYLIEFFICILKCFFILLVLGEFLPKVIDYILYKYLEKISIHHNSILVYNIITKNKKILYNYIYIFNEFVKM